MADVLAAARAGNEEHLLALLQSGFPVNGCDKEGFTPLHKACTRDHYACAKILIAHGADVNGATRTGWTPLHKACDAGAARCTRLLLSHHAKVDAQTNSGKTALMRACRNSHTACVRLLLSPNVPRHPQLDLQDNEGYTAIHRAVQYSADEEILNLVGLECRAKMTPCAGTGYTPLHTAVHKRDIRLMSKCVSMGSNANVPDAKGWSAVHHCAELGDYRLLHWCVDEAGGAAGIASPIDGETPLHRAAWGGDLTSVKYLISHGAAVTARNATGWTPAHCAAWVGAEDVLRFLAGRGARLDVENDDGWTPERMLPGSAVSSAPPRRKAGRNGESAGADAGADAFGGLRAEREIQVAGSVDLPA